MFNVGEKAIGGMMKIDAEMAKNGAQPAWCHYTVVEDVNQATDRAKSLGGTHLHGPVPVPGGQISMFADPQGALFAFWAGEAQN